MKKQILVRTYPHYFSVGTQELEDALNMGYCVIMCNKIGDVNEYILEIEVEEKGVVNE